MPIAILTVKLYNKETIRGGERRTVMADEELRIIFAKKLNHYLELNGYNQADLARHMNEKVNTYFEKVMQHENATQKEKAL